MDHYKLRIKDPSGAEFEAEGPADFIHNEKESFLSTLSRSKAAQAQPAALDTRKNAPKADFWAEIVEVKGDFLKLKFKTPGLSPAEAALILLAAGRSLDQTEDLGALTLSKALKTSGYEPDRLDRLLTREVKDGRVTASGTKRNRTYRITQKGLEKAYRAINKTAPND